MMFSELKMGRWFRFANGGTWLWFKTGANSAHQASLPYGGSYYCDFGVLVKEVRYQFVPKT